MAILRLVGTLINTLIHKREMKKEESFIQVLGIGEFGLQVANELRQKAPIINVNISTMEISGCNAVCNPNKMPHLVMGIGEILHNAHVLIVVVDAGDAISVSYRDFYVRNALERGISCLTVFRFQSEDEAKSYLKMSSYAANGAILAVCPDVNETNESDMLRGMLSTIETGEIHFSESDFSNLICGSGYCAWGESLTSAEKGIAVSVSEAMREIKTGEGIVPAMQRVGCYIFFALPKDMDSIGLISCARAGLKELEDVENLCWDVDINDSEDISTKIFMSYRK